MGLKWRQSPRLKLDAALFQLRAGTVAIALTAVITTRLIDFRVKKALGVLLHRNGVALGAYCLAG